MHYEYKCECGEVFDEFRSVEQRRTAPCPACGRLAPLQFIPNAGLNHIKPFQSYVDTNLSPSGDPILVESRSQKRRMMKQQGLDWMPSVRWV